MSNNFDFDAELNKLIENTVKPNLENFNYTPYGKEFSITPKEANELEKSILESAKNIVLTKDTGIPRPEDLEKIPEDIRRKEYERQRMFVENLTSRFRNTSDRIDIKVNDNLQIETERNIDYKKIVEAKEQLKKANKDAMQSLYEIEDEN